MVNLSDAKLSKNISKSLTWLHLESEQSDLHVYAVLRDKLTIYVTFKTNNPRIKSELNNRVLTSTIAQYLNADYGSDLVSGHIQFGSTEQVSVQYMASSTLGRLLD